MKIKEVSEQLNLPSDTIRYWEKAGIAGTVGRDSSGYRDYTPQVVDWLRLVKCFREIDIPIETIKAYIDLAKKGDVTADERKLMLEKHRLTLQAKLDEYQEALKGLNRKIANYDHVKEVSFHDRNTEE